MNLQQIDGGKKNPKNWKPKNKTEKPHQKPTKQKNNKQKNPTTPYILQWILLFQVVSYSQAGQV